MEQINIDVVNYDIEDINYFLIKINKLIKAYQGTESSELFQKRLAILVKQYEMMSQCYVTCVKERYLK